MTVPVAGLDTAQPCVSPHQSGQEKAAGGRTQEWQTRKQGQEERQTTVRSHSGDEDAERQTPKATGTFFRNAAAVSLFVAVIRFTPSGDCTRMICVRETRL